MNRQRFDENADQSAAAHRGTDHTLLCATTGCGRRWTCDFGRRLCSDCDARRQTSHARKPPQSSLPAMGSLRDAVRPFTEPAEREEEYRHDDRA